MAKMSSVCTPENSQPAQWPWQGARLLLFEDLLQRCFNLTRRCQPLEFGPHHPLPIDDKEPRLGLQAPLRHRGEELVCRSVPPDLLVRKDDAIAIRWEERPHDIHHGPADPTGTELRRGKHDDLRLALRDRIRDANLMEPWVRGIARIDLTQVLHVAGDQVVAPRRW